MPHQMLQGHKIYASISIVLAYQCVRVSHSVCVYVGVYGGVHSTIDLYSAQQRHIVSWQRIALIIGMLQKLANILHTLCKWRSLCVPNIYSAYA